MNVKNYIQVGVTALRTPTGQHYQAIPLYIETDKLTASGLTIAEGKLLCNFAGFVLEEYGRHIRKQQQGV